MNPTAVLDLFISSAGLLWGNPRDCLDPTNTNDRTCNGGLASVASIIRNRSGGDADGTGTTTQHLFIPKLDRQNIFVQSHPSGIGVNKLISHDHFGWNAYTAPPYFFVRDFPELQTRDFRAVLSNLDLQRSSPWEPFLESVYFDLDTGATFVHLNPSPPAPARGGPYFVEYFLRALDYVAKVNQLSGCYDDEKVNGEGACRTHCWLPPIIYFNDFDEQLFNELLQVGLKHEHPPLLIYGLTGEILAPRIAENKTAFVTIPVNRDELLSHLRIEVDQGQKNERIVSSVNLTRFNLEELPEEFKDAEYIEDLQYLRSLADKAIVNDPVVGTSGFMPLTRTGDWRKCMGGECPIGNLFTDAIRGDADFAVVNSGGLRGPGWPAGNITVGNIWSALPFLNHRCTGVMSGVSVFRLLNHSTALATYESTYTALGDRLLQMSGMKMSYNTLIVNGTRLISVEMWDNEANEYLPLERLKLYKFATTSWMCNHFDQFPSLFGSDLQMEEEIPGSLDYSKSINEIVADYLTTLGSTYDTTPRGSHMNDTQVFEPMKFIQNEESCLIDYYWQRKKLSCLPCPSGKNVKFSDELISFFITPDSRDFGGRNILYNRELFNVTLASKSIPSWVVFRQSSNDLMGGPTILQHGESIAIEFDIDVSILTEGTTQGTVSFETFIGGDYPGCLTDFVNFDSLVELRSEENLNQIGVIRPAGWSLMALAVGLAGFFFAWTYKHRQHRVLKASQPMFMQLICIGTFIMALSIIPLSIDDSIASPEVCSKACMAVPWLVCSGFAITFSTLLAKLWRVHKVMSAAQNFRRIVVHQDNALKSIAILLTLNFVLLLCWTLTDPYVWRREIIDQDPTKSYGFCVSQGKTRVAILTLLILLNGSAIVLACERAYRARNMGDDSYIESRWVGVACLSWLQVLIIGIPIILLTRRQPVAAYFTRVAMVFLICVSMLLFMFLPKMRLMSQPQETPASGVYQQRMTTNTSPSTETESRLTHRINELEKMLVEARQGATRSSDSQPCGPIDASHSNEIGSKQQISELEKRLKLKESNPISALSDSPLFFSCVSVSSMTCNIEQV
mmetsp:Transcript_32071/g.59275  ORF Transcript_32071/g.59275 Transcript_32071/m.59275 type:complete len:1074 (+) Transcript_32071:111-3332(+)|eukprot:CAMPEP_0196139478 /NCGR_PEP_ID=MMETSP0910-20130528/6737_1 /TAXON_ID=49265 /ORGANISM="Thalassiosira rotula, Strain GSO102" /LENGTH=1073 /DNA_ID=CAMNT_0041400207 /DNA_START=35 /DNA_END=3256 /DNA_ORIENTATION=-